MASSQGAMSAADRAGDVARRLEQGWIGTEHAPRPGPATGRSQPGPEHYLIAMVYGEHAVCPPLHQLGSDEPALLDALARRGVPVPEADPPVFRPWRGHQRIDVTEAELKPVIDVLSERHPPGSEWRWGFNWYPADPEGHDRPRRAWVDGEEGIDLDAALATARERLAGA